MHALNRSSKLLPPDFGEKCEFWIFKFHKLTPVDFFLNSKYCLWLFTHPLHTYVLRPLYLTSPFYLSVYLHILCPLWKANEESERKRYAAVFLKSFKYNVKVSIKCAVLFINKIIFNVFSAQILPLKLFFSPVFAVCQRRL